MAKPAASSIGLITCPTYFIGGFDAESRERQMALAKIQEVYRELAIHGEVSFNLPVLNGLPLDVAKRCVQTGIPYRAYSPFGRWDEYHNKTPEIAVALGLLQDSASEVFFPNGEDQGYSPARVAKCYRAIASASEMVILVGTEPMYKYWIERLRGKYLLYIDAQKIGS